MDKSKQGKRNRAAGARFELKVRKDLESKGWNVSKYMNNVEFMRLDQINKEGLKLDWKPFNQEDKNGPVLGRSIPAKHKFRGTGIPMAIGTGFPDFIAINRDGYKVGTIDNPKVLNEVIGVEAKSNGYLKPEEKEKCRWLLDQRIFSKVLIVKKGTKRGQIVYNEFN